MPDPIFYRRMIERHLAEALEDSPVVLIHGPRQCGKTTLAQFIRSPDYPVRGSGRLVREGYRPDQGYEYISFDNPTTIDSAREDPVGFVAELPERIILDEIQRVPELFPVIKTAVDRQRTPGRFLLTGSTDVRFVSQLSEALAGRLQTVRLHPLAQCELADRADTANPESGFLGALFGDGFAKFQSERLGASLAEKIVAGGYPPALTRPTEKRRSNWYRDYIETLIRQDARDMSRIQSLDILPRLLAAAAGQTARLFNLTDLAAPFERSQPTIRDYVTLLERLFLLERLPSWSSNRLKRLVKREKLHLTDTGLAAALLDVGTGELRSDRAKLGQLLETFVLQELQRQASWHETQTRFFHFRDKDGIEVDIVIEQRAGTVSGVEVKAAETVKPGDFRGLRKLERAVGDRFVRGVVLYDGEACVPFGKRLHAVPIRRLWETT